MGLEENDKDISYSALAAARSFSFELLNHVRLPLDEPSSAQRVLDLKMKRNVCI